MKQTGEQFLDTFFRELYMSDLVQHTKENRDSREEAIKRYLARLEEIHRMANTEEKKELLARLYYKKYVIKAENIPYSADKEAIINAQKKTLRMWIDYLTDPTTSYPMWARYWAFQGMRKMGAPDETKDMYGKRDDKTIAPFVDANPEIIAKCIDFIVKQVEGENLSDEELMGLSKYDSFNKIYSHFERLYQRNVVETSDSNDGIWVKYEQGKEEDARKLNKSLINKNTGWCTASSEDIAIRQVCGPYEDTRYGGDFYVYYTKDKNGEYTIPRIAMRCIGHQKIGEIRGIEKGQNLEENLIDILEKQLRSMTFIDENSVNNSLNIIEGLRTLTRINIKTNHKEPLTEEEINSLYSKKFGFGYQNDPRILRIIGKRDHFADYNSTSSKAVKLKMLEAGHAKESSVDDEELIFEALERNPFAFKYATEELRGNIDLVITAYKKSNYSFSYIADSLKENRDYILGFVTMFPSALRFIPEKYAKDKELIIAALNNDGMALKYVQSDMQADKDVAIAAIRKNWQAYDFVGFKIRFDKDVVMELLKKYDKYDKRNMEAYLKMISAAFNRGHYVDGEKNILYDRKTICLFLRKNGLLIERMSFMRDDKKVVATAVRQNEKAIKYASEKLLKDKRFIASITRFKPAILSYIPTEYLDKSLLKMALKGNATVIEYIPKDMIDDELLRIYDKRKKFEDALMDFIEKIATKIDDAQEKKTAKTR